MKTVYKAIMARLKEKVPQIKWIDLDEGQIDRQTERPAIAFPAVLISIALNGCTDIYGKTQHCPTAVSVRIIQNPPVSRTNSTASEAVLETALKRYELIDEVYAALQCFETDGFNGLSRTGQRKETRSDGLFVYKIEFSTEFEDMTAEE